MPALGSFSGTPGMFWDRSTDLKPQNPSTLPSAPLAVSSPRHKHLKATVAAIVFVPLICYFSMTVSMGKGVN